MPIIEDDSPDPSLIPTPKPERPSWMDNNGTPKTAYPPGFDTRHTGNPPGNPNLLDPVKAKDPAFNPGMGFQKGIAQNPGHKIKPENKSIRKALVRLMNEPSGKVSKIRSKADEVAHRLYELSKSSDPRSALIAIRELSDRTDGKTAPSTQELDAMKDSGAKVVMINSGMRPDRNDQVIIELRRPLLEEPEQLDEEDD
jgi:hypothetical protein